MRGRRAPRGTPEGGAAVTLAPGRGSALRAPQREGPAPRPAPHLLPYHPRGNTVREPLAGTAAPPGQHGETRPRPSQAGHVARLPGRCHAQPTPKFNGCPDRRQPPPWTGSGRGRTRLCPTAPTAARGLRSTDPPPALCPGSSPEASPSQSPHRVPSTGRLEAGAGLGAPGSPADPPVSGQGEPRCVRGRGCC